MLRLEKLRCLHLKNYTQPIEFKFGMEVKLVLGKNGRRIKRPLPFTPDCFYCVKYPVEHVLKLKGVQVLRPKVPREGGRAQQVTFADYLVNGLF